MGTAALVVVLMTVAGVRSQDGESIATSFLSGQFTVNVSASGVFMHATCLAYIRALTGT
jgi:hypothetical protein